uniref:Uncharacterized protein n=1 Tax=viral metagenome TaxID=1070528 RepID=A0A6M3Y229_9ZZZZ
MDELFKKIYVKSEADLPKKDGEYFAKLHGAYSVHECEFSMFYEKQWIEDIDWYLQPIEGSITVQHNLREELIKYDKWMVEVKWGTDVPSAEKSVDEYLKSKHTKNDTKDNIKDLLREYGCYGIGHNEDANNKLIEALNDLIDTERRAIIKALEEYANQFKTKSK